MLLAFTLDLEGRLFGVLFGLSVGSLITWVLATWRRNAARRDVLRGDARDTLVIEQHIIERGTAADGRPVPKRLRIRYLGQRALGEVIPNAHLASELHARAQRVTDLLPLIALEGPTGTFLLETLTGYVCDRVANDPFDHDIYIMTVCREPVGLAYHHPISVLLIPLRDLELFLRWEDVRDLEVEHTTDSVRALTLMDLARQWRLEQALVARHRAEGKSIRFLETMFQLDLALDQRAAAVATRPAPWERYEAALRARGLSAT